MKRARVITVAVAGAGLAIAIVAAATPLPQPDLPSPQLEALSGIDVAPTPFALEAAFGAQPLDDLIVIARDPAEDPGIRLRAYRAMSLYPGAQARTTLTTDILALTGTAQAGADLLYLRAAVEALGVVGQPPDVDAVIPLLNFERSRDIRAAAADALRHIHNTSDTVLDALRTRLHGEQSEQVVLAISRALRELQGL